MTPSEIITQEAQLINEKEILVYTVVLKNKHLGWKV